ncbi:MAG: macro domain-containing protein [Candidatus Glassbacteria bacterium]
MKRELFGKVIELVQGDITELDTDAIVNPANVHLQMGGGVAGAIRRKGGKKIQEECDQIGRIEVGEAVITGGGDLRARHVIHAVGPRMGEGDEDRKLRAATLNSLKVADENALKSIAFPAISTGIFGYPLDRCAVVMLNATKNYLSGESGLERIVFCLYDSLALEKFKKALAELPG